MAATFHYQNGLVAGWKQCIHNVQSLNTGAEIIVELERRMNECCDTSSLAAQPRLAARSCSPKDGPTPTVRVASESLGSPIRVLKLS